MSFLRVHKAEIGIFLIAVAVRLLYFGISLESRDGNFIATVSGADGYYTISQNILAGNGYSSELEAPYEKNAVRPPVQPYFLVLSHLLFGSYWGALILQILISAAVAVLAMRIARYLTDRRSVPLCVGVFMALEPFGVLFSIMFYSETVFMLLLCLSVLTLFKTLREYRSHLLLLSAAFLGLSILTKPVVQYLPLVFALIIFWHFRRASVTHAAGRAVLFAMACLLVVSPWMYRNYREFGVPTLSPLQGVAFYSVLVPSVLAVKNGTTFADEYAAIRARGADDPNEAKIERAGEYTALALPILLANPIPLAVVLANTTTTFFTHDGILDVLRHVDAAPTQRLHKPALLLLFTEPGKVFGLIRQVATEPAILVLFARVGWVCITLAFIAGAWFALRRRPTVFASTALIIVLYFALTSLSAGFGTNARYRLPVNLFIVTFAACAVADMVARRRGALLSHEN